MSKRQDAIMMKQVRDRRHEISPESYAYYMSRRGGSSYGRETEGSAVDGSREYGLQLNGGRSGGRLRSRSPRYYHQGTRMDDIMDVEIVHRHRRSVPPLELRERYEPAEGTISPNLKGFCKYGNTTLEGGGDEYFPVDRVAVSDEIDTVRSPTTVEDRGMVRPHHHIQHASNYGETSSHFLSGSASQIIDSRVQYVNHLSVDRSRNLDAYNALNMDVYNEQGKRPLSLRDTSYPVSSKSPVNNYPNVTPALRTGGYIPPFCQGIQHMHSDDLYRKISKPAEKSLFDAYEDHPSHHSILDHQSNVRDSMTKLKSTHGLIHHLNYHPPTIEEGLNGDGELGYLSGGGYRPEHSGSGQTYRQKASGNIKEANRFLSDEDCEHLRLHSRRDCYSARLSSNLLNEIEDNYTSNHSPRDFRLSHLLSNERYIRPDPQSCCTLPEKFLHGGAAYDHKDPHFVTPSEYDPGFMASGTWVDDYHKHAAKTNYADSRADSICNTEEDRDELMRTNYWSSSDSKKQAGEEYYNARSTLSSPEPREEYVDSEMYNPEIRRDMKQYGQYIDMPPQEREHVDRKDKYRGSHIEWIDTEVGSVYDVNITSKYDMVVGGLDSNKQRWTEEDPNVCGAPNGMLKMKSVTFKRTNKHNLGVGASHRRCNTNSSRYLSGRDDILSEEGMIIHPPERIGSDSARHTGSRSIFDRLGSPRSSNNQFSPRRLQGHVSDFISRKHEHRQTKGHTKSNHRTLNGSPYLNKGSPCYERLKSSKTNTDDSHMKHMEDMETLEDVDTPVNPASGDNTEDFKQSVQKAFLLISQKMNENPATRRRYRGQGKAGTLFCIICKRRNSKEFKDARGLAAHSLTFDKSGLKAQHLGLYKAICVTMGWSSDIDQETGTWAPQVLPEDKALAQKEDLICWPPVFIVYNVSCLRKNHFHKVLTTKELEAFFRSKGFITGRVKVCLGQSTNSHIMVVKFLGTFSGLKDAENLHKHYAENERGRVEFGKLACSNAMGCQPCETVDNAALSDLYGYMGIAEDWDKLDVESKKRCIVKSKQEILDFSAEPIQPGAN